MIVALAVWAAFMTPSSSPVTTLVLGPGQYRFGDFLKVGVPFTLLVTLNLVCVLQVPWLLPRHVLLTSELPNSLVGISRAKPLAS